MKTLNIHQEFVLNGMTTSIIHLAQRGVQAITGNPPAASRQQLSEALTPLLGATPEPETDVTLITTESQLFQANLKLETLQSAFDSLVNVAKAGDPMLHGVTIDPETGDLVCDYGAPTEEERAEKTAQIEETLRSFGIDPNAPVRLVAEDEILVDEPDTTMSDAIAAAGAEEEGEDELAELIDQSDAAPPVMKDETTEETSASQTLDTQRLPVDETKDDDVNA